MKLHVKICGITRDKDALLAENLGASAIGFVFFQKSPRYITPEKAGKISDKLGPFIARVGVFVDEEPGEVKKTAKTARQEYLHQANARGSSRQTDSRSPRD